MINQGLRSQLSADLQAVRLVGHTMVWHDGKHTVDPKRRQGFKSNDPVGVAAQTKQLAFAGLDVLMFNWYGQGTYEDSCAKVYVAHLSGLSFMINIDGACVTSLASLRSQLAYIRSTYFPNPAYEKHNGKYVVTHFYKTGNQRAWFAAAETENPDVTFVYDSNAMGHNQMGWVQIDLEANADWWVRTYGLRNDGSLNIPCVAAGFNDLNSLTGYGVWGAKPARIWPPAAPGPGPNRTTFDAFVAVINKYYNAGNRGLLPYLQIVTINDKDEGTDLFDRGFLAAEIKAPPTHAYHVEAWLDGQKLASVPVGAAQEATVRKVNELGQVVASATLELKP